MKRIAVDIDGVLTHNGMQSINWYETTPNQFIEIYKRAVPNLEAIAETNRYIDEGHAVFLYTARDHCYREVTEEWLDKNGVLVPKNRVRFNKLYFDCFIDDRATNDWDELRRMVDGS